MMICNLWSIQSRNPMPKLIKFIALIISLNIFTQCDYISTTVKKKKSDDVGSIEEKKLIDIVKCDTIKNNSDSIEKLYEKDISRIISNISGHPSDDRYVFKGYSKWKIDKKTTLKMEIYCVDWEPENESKDWSPVIRYCKLINPQNKSRKDSTIYKNGTWELMEWYYEDENNSKTVYISTSGSKITNIYDSLGRIISNVHIEKNGDTITSERYVWEENGRLIQIITRGDEINMSGFVIGGPTEPPKFKPKVKSYPKYVVRNFIYNTPCDSVRVEPTDYGRYDKSFGKIPDESDAFEYERFKINPYMYTGNVLLKQKARCEEYKESQSKMGDKK